MEEELFKKKGLPNGFKCIILYIDILLTLTMGGNMTVLTVNGVNQVVDAPGDTRLLWVIREHLRLTGTKFGCGILFPIVNIFIFIIRRFEHGAFFYLHSNF